MINGQINTYVLRVFRSRFYFQQIHFKKKNKNIEQSIRNKLSMKKKYFFFYRKIALVIILTRAGLDLDPKAMKAMKITVPKIGLVPWTVEAGVVAATTYYFMELPLMWGLLLGSIIAAVSPAVVVPCLFRLRGRGYGVAKVSLSHLYMLKRRETSCFWLQRARDRN